MHFPHRVALKMPDSQTLVMSTAQAAHTTCFKPRFLFVRRRKQGGARHTWYSLLVSLTYRFLAYSICSGA